MSSVTSTPGIVTVNLENGFTSTTTTKNNADGMPISVENDTYQNGVLDYVDTQNFTYNNGVETVNWTATSKTFNTTSSGTYTMNY